MSATRDLYETDFYAWTREQAAAVRAAATPGANLPVDWENVAEEIESLGSAQRRELASCITTIIEHLLKLEGSPAAEPRRGWIDTVVRSRQEIALSLKGSPSLRPDLPELVSDGVTDAVRLVGTMLRQYGEATPAVIARLRGTAFTPEQVLGDWFPGTVTQAADDTRDR